MTDPLPQITVTLSPAHRRKFCGKSTYTTECTFSQYYILEGDTMFNSKNLIRKLDEFEVHNPYDISLEELNAIIDDCRKDEDPLLLATFHGFQLGCMKAGRYYV